MTKAATFSNLGRRSKTRTQKKSRANHRNKTRFWSSLKSLFNKLRSLLIAFFKALAVVGALLLFAFGILQTSLFDVNEIRVEGNSQLTKETVIESSAIKTGGSLAMVDVVGARKKLMANPWVKDAKIQHDWPHGVVVKITERKPVALGKSESQKWVTLSSDGHVLTSGEKPAFRLPVLLSVQPPDTPSTEVSPDGIPIELTVASALPDNLKNKVTQVRRTGNNLELGLSSGVVVELGDEKNLGAKLMAASTVLSQSDEKKLRILDVRSPQLPVGR